MKNKIRAWAAFDWAAQPFHTLVVTFVFIPYFNQAIIGDPEQGQILVSWMATISALLVAFAAPVISSITDQGGNRKRWMWLFSILYLIGCYGLIGTVSVKMLMAAYILGYFAIEMLLVTINAYLPEFEKHGDIGQISGNAWGYGYLGGLVLLIVFLGFLMPNGDSDKTLIGMTALLGKDAALYSGPASALWYVVFMIPFFMLFKNEKGKKSASVATRDGLKGLKVSLKKAWADTRLRWFFVSSMIYRDALAGLFIFGALYAQNVLGWDIVMLGAYGIVLNITGTIGGVGGGFLDRKYGSAFVVKLSLYMFVLICFVVMSTNRTSAIFIPIAEGSKLPDILFFICGMFIGIGAGALQGASRGMVVPETGGKMLSGEAFGIYGMTGRATAFIAPTLIGIVTTITHSSQLGVWPIFGLFVIAIICFNIFEKSKR